MSSILLINIVTICACVSLMTIALSHIRFFDKTDKELGNKIKHVFLADFLSVLSILSFNINNIISGHPSNYTEAMRVWFKGAQCLTVLYTLFASWSLYECYRRIK